MDWALVGLEFSCTSSALLFQCLDKNKKWMEVIFIKTGKYLTYVFIIGFNIIKNSISFVI